MKPLMILATSLALSSFALAEPTTYKDWMTNAGPDEIFNKESCQAATNVATGTNRTQLLLSFAKDKTAIPQLLVKVWDQAVPETQLLMKVSSKISYPLFLWKASTQPDQPSIYWYAPIGWSPLADYIAAANSLSIQGSTTNITISLRGSSVSLQRTAECLKSDELLPLDFLKKLNTKTAVNANLYASVDEMIAGNEGAYTAYREGVKKTADLASLRKNSAKLLNQEAEAKTLATNANASWERTVAELNKQMNTQTQLQQKLNDTNVDLAKQQEALPMAAQDEKAKLAAYSPVREEFNRYAAEANDRQNSLDQNISESRTLRGRISELESQIPSLNNEASAINSQINSLRYEVDRARRDYESKDMEARRFDVERLYGEALRRDIYYNDRIETARRAQSDAARFASDSSQLQAQRNTTAIQLQQCQAVQPPQDCSAYQNAVNQLDVQIRQAEDNRQRSLNAASQAQREADSQANNIHNDLQNRKYNLVRIADEAERRYRSISADLYALQDRLNQINSTLPNLRNELNYSRERLSSLDSQRGSLQRALQEAIAARDAARIRLNYDKLKADYLAAKNLRESIEEAISNDNSTIQDLQRSLKRTATLIQDLTKEEATKAIRRDDTAKKLNDIQESLKNFRTQEAEITQKITELAAQFETDKSRYQRTYESWIAPASNTSPLRLETQIGTF